MYRLTESNGTFLAVDMGDAIDTSSIREIVNSGDEVVIVEDINELTDDKLYGLPVELI